MCSQVGRLGGLPLTFPWAGLGWACFKGHVDRLRGQQGRLPQEAPPLALGLLQPASRQRPGRAAWWSGRGPCPSCWSCTWFLRVRWGHPSCRCHLLLLQGTKELVWKEAVKSVSSAAKSSLGKDLSSVYLVHKVGTVTPFVIGPWGGGTGPCAPSTENSAGAWEVLRGGEFTVLALRVPGVAGSWKAQCRYRRGHRRSPRILFIHRHPPGKTQIDLSPCAWGEQQGQLVTAQGLRAGYRRS